MEKVVSLFKNDSEINKPVQRFYIFSEANQEITHSTVDVKSLMALFDSKDISLSDDTIDNLDTALINSVNDYYCNFKAEIGLHQLLTMTALYCSYSPLYSDLKAIHNNANFSYFVSILDVVDEKTGDVSQVVRDKVLPIDRPISGDLLDDIFEALVLEQKALNKNINHISSSAL